MPTQSLQPELNQADYQIGANNGVNFRKRPMTSLEDEKSKSFAAYSPGEARSAATQWLSDFTDHGPLRIMSIRVTEERGLNVPLNEHWTSAVTRQFPFTNWRRGNNGGAQVGPAD